MTNQTLKYSPEDPGVSEEKLDAFFTSYVNGDLKPFLKSADVPDNWDAEPVKILTGKNFKEVALDESKHVFVEFCECIEALYKYSLTILQNILSCKFRVFIFKIFRILSNIC